jgi:hypothetical protein
MFRPVKGSSSGWYLKYISNISHYWYNNEWGNMWTFRKILKWKYRLNFVYNYSTCVSRLMSICKKIMEILAKRYWFCWYGRTLLYPDGQRIHTPRNLDLIGKECLHIVMQLLYSGNLYKQYIFLCLSHLEEYKDYNTKCYKSISCLHSAGESTDSQAFGISVEIVWQTVKLFKTSCEY